MTGETLAVLMMAFGLMIGLVGTWLEIDCLEERIKDLEKAGDEP